MNTIQQAIIENLSDGITTPMSFLLPMLLTHGAFDAKALIIGTIGGGISMAYAFKSMQASKGTWYEWFVAFVCSIIGGLIPIFLFVTLPRLFAAVLTGLFVIVAIVYIAKQKQAEIGLKPAIYDTAKNIVPALLIVGVISTL